MIYMFMVLSVLKVKLELRTFPLKLLKCCESLNTFSSLGRILFILRSSFAFVFKVLLCYFAPKASAKILGAIITNLLAYG